MKRIIFVVSVLLCAIYLVAFCLNVQQLAAMHRDLQIFYPFDVIVLSGIALLIMGIVRFFKPYDNKWFMIPLLFLVCGIITIRIGSNTPCCIGG